MGLGAGPVIGAFCTTRPGTGAGSTGFPSIGPGSGPGVTGSGAGAPACGRTRGM